MGFAFLTVNPRIWYIQKSLTCSLSEYGSLGIGVAECEENAEAEK